MTLLILATSAALCVSALCSLLEAILYSTRQISLEAAASSGDKLAQRMRLFKAKVERPLAAILILNTIANTIGASVAGWAAGELWGPSMLWVFSLVFTLAILAISEIAPKTIGAVYWRKLWRPAVYPITFMVNALTPLVWMTQAITRGITKGQESKAQVSEEEILAAARLGAHGGEISKLEHDLIRNIIQLEDKKASDIMTPRTVLLAVADGATLAELKEQANSWDHTRLPVYHGDKDHILGYLLKDEVRAANPEDLPEGPRGLVHQMRFVPGSVNALDLLAGFLRRREHICMVVDEYGGVMGLVTLEDVLESMVGQEIVDEKDQVVDMQDMARKRGQSLLAEEGGSGI